MPDHGTDADPFALFREFPTMVEAISEIRRLRAIIAQNESTRNSSADDILTRLRQYRHESIIGASSVRERLEICDDAAKEIERLNAALAAATQEKSVWEREARNG